jgi:hypothetical protein
MSRDDMRSLKANKDEEARVAQINNLVTQMYRSAVNVASTSTNLQYSYIVQESYGDFVEKNIDHIIIKLRVLFPNCSVDYKTVKMARGTDRQMHDISTLDPMVMRFIGQVQVTQSIVIDWS